MKAPVAYILAEIGWRESSRTFGRKGVLEIADVIDNGKNPLCFSSNLSETKQRNAFYRRTGPGVNATVVVVVCNPVESIAWNRKKECDGWMDRAQIRLFDLVRIQSQ